jgi:hypothetical protein
MTDIPLDLPAIDPPSIAAKRQRRQRVSSGSKPKTNSGITLAQLETGLTKQFELLGALLSGFDSYDGGVIVDKAPNMAEALIEVAKSSPTAKRFLEGLVATGAWSGVVMVLGGDVLLPIAVHHRMLPGTVNDVIATIQDIPLRESKNNDSTKEQAEYIASA